MEITACPRPIRRGASDAAGRADDNGAVTFTTSVRPSAAPTHAVPAAPVLRVSRLSVRFGALQVLSGVDLTLRSGELVAVAGENGAGKSTLMRCVVGDLALSSGSVEVGGRRVGGGRAALKHPGVGVVWQEAAQCDNLDVASNLLLGRERAWVMRSDSEVHAAAAAILADLGIPIADTTRPMASLPRAHQQLVAIARAVQGDPALLVLDEPTGSLGVHEAELVEHLIARLHRSGKSILLVSHDIPQMMRLADRIAVLRHGAITADINPTGAHPDDVAGLIAGRPIDTSARRQLVRLQDLVDRLATADTASGLPLVVTALAAALGVDRLCLHLVDARTLNSAWTLGLASADTHRLAQLPFGPEGGPAGVAAESGQPAVDLDGMMRIRAGWLQQNDSGQSRACYAVPVVGSTEILGVVTVFRTEPGAPPQDEIDLVSLYAGYMAGVVERQAAESARQEAAALRRSHDVQRQFLSRLSHELRTPLTAIRGYASSLEQSDVVWDPASQGRFLTRISDESARLGRLVGDLLDFSAIESGVLRLNLDWCDVRLVLQAARECLSREGAEAVSVVCPAMVPSLWADHDRLEQVFVNLLDNAVRHNPPGTRVTAEVHAAADGVVVTVTDDGIGLPPGDLDDHRDASPRRATSGSGLGLSIARGIVEAHGGSIHVEPVEVGTRFAVHLLEDPRVPGWSDSAEW